MAKPKMIRTQQYDDGYCVICTTYGKLTHDHIFPHAIRRPGARELLSMQAYFKSGDQRPRFAQDEAKFKTICTKCNNDVLGGEYDPALADLARQVARPVNTALETGLVIPTNVRIRFKPLRVMRAIFGHVLASQFMQDVNERPKEGTWQRSIRDFVLNSRRPMPTGFEVYWRFYPSWIEVAIGYRGLLRIGHQHISGSFIKFFPFAFWIVHRLQREPATRITLPRFPFGNAADVDDEIDAIFSLHCPVRPDWPEKVGDDEILFGHDQSFVVSKPRSVSSKKRGFK